MVQATRWRQDSVLLPTSPYQRVRFAPTFPSGSGNADSAFGWSPIPIDGSIVDGGSPNGFSPYSGLSGVGVRLMGIFGGPLSTGGIAKTVGILSGLAIGFICGHRRKSHIGETGQTIGAHAVVNGNDVGIIDLERKARIRVQRIRKREGVVRGERWQWSAGSVVRILRRANAVVVRI